MTDAADHQGGEPRRVPGAHSRRPARGVPKGPGAGVWRLPVLVLTLSVLVVVGLVAGAAPAAHQASPALITAEAAPPGAVSSSWYCTGGSGPGGSAPATLDLVNEGTGVAQGTVTVVNDTGATASAPVRVPAGSQTTVSTASIQHGTWLAARVDLSAGAVTVSQQVASLAGWSQAPCATTTASNWYFASGSTSSGNQLFVSVYNPTTTTAVADLTFDTPGGQQQPPPFQGLVLAPETLVVAQVGSYVQNASSVAAVVQTRSGQVVASELQQYATSGVVGMSLRLGTPVPETSWYVPRTYDVTGSGAATSFVVFNPTDVPQRVTVAAHVASGALAPFVEEVPAFGTWTLNASSQSRIPPNEDYSMTVTSTGGPGVVVDRVVVAPPGAPGPQWGAMSAVPGPVTQVTSERWVLPAPGGGSLPVSGAGWVALGLQNAGSAPVAVRVVALTPTGPQTLAGLGTLHVPPGGFAKIEQSVLQAGGTNPLLVEATGPLAAMAEGVPAGAPGVVGLGALPLG